MDPINIIAGLNLVATFGANFSGAKRGLKSSIILHKEKPKTYLQKVPLVISVLSLIAFLLGLFQVGSLPYNQGNFSIRFVGLTLYMTFSWMQIWSFKSLGDNHSQDIIILKNHTLIQKGPYRVVRHPQYAAQILMDIGAGLLTMSYLVLPLAIIQIPFLIMRAFMEENLLEKYFKKDFEEYKKKSGSFFPFVG